MSLPLTHVLQPWFLGPDLPSCRLGEICKISPVRPHLNKNDCAARTSHQPNLTNFASSKVVQKKMVSTIKRSRTGGTMDPDSQCLIDEV
jgi:hypothetical protein